MNLDFGKFVFATMRVKASSDIKAWIISVIVYAILILLQNMLHLEDLKYPVDHYFLMINE